MVTAVGQTGVLASLSCVPPLPLLACTTSMVDPPLCNYLPTSRNKVITTTITVKMYVRKKWPLVNPVYCVTH